MKTNLPSLPTSFIGRAEELAEISALLVDPACRLLTLTGPGGIGKTRLAIQAAHRVASLDPGTPPHAFSDGIYFVPLQPLSSADFIVPAIAKIVGYAFRGTDDPLQQLLQHLKDRRLLLVLDNFEDLLEGASLLSEILQVAPQVKLLVTSRVTLGLQEEWLRPVHGLRYPVGEAGIELDRIGDWSAVQLFAERARRIQPDFNLPRDLGCTLTICRLVEGMPLALELAVSWLRVLSCAEITAEIERSLNFLATSLRNIPDRHRSMQAVFEQSWRLLTPQEREIFKALSVFRGGFDRRAAEAVAFASLGSLQALVDKSLLVHTASGRYNLHELLRQYAASRLDEGSQEREAVEERHCRYFAEFLQSTAARLKGPEQSTALSEIDTEIDNLRQAWRWAADRGREAEICQLLEGLPLYYQMRSRLVEGRETFVQAARRFRELGIQEASALYVTEAWFRVSVGGYESVWDLYAGLFSILSRPLVEGNIAFPLIGFGFHYQNIGPEPVESLFQENLAYYRQRGDTWGTAWTLYSLGTVAERQRDIARAKSLLGQSLEYFRSCGDRWGSTFALNYLGPILMQEGDYTAAQPLFLEALNICKAIGDQGGVSFSMHYLGRIATMLQDYETSWQYLVNAARIVMEHSTYMFYWHLYEIAESFLKVGRKIQAVELLSFLERNIQDEEERQYIQSVIKPLEPELEQPDLAAAWQRGKTATRESLVEALEIEFGQKAESAARTEDTSHRPVVGEPVPLPEPLSPRELEVLGFLESGLSNREIARKMTVTEGTVKKHLNNIFGKLEVTSRTQAVARARALRLI